MIGENISEISRSLLEISYRFSTIEVSYIFFLLCTDNSNFKGLVLSLLVVCIVWAHACLYIWSFVYCIIILIIEILRFASFIEGNSHLSDEEILEYETSFHAEVTDDETSDENAEEDNSFEDWHI